MDNRDTLMNICRRIGSVVDTMGWYQSSIIDDDISSLCMATCSRDYTDIEFYHILDILDIDLYDSSRAYTAITDNIYMYYNYGEIVVFIHR